VENHVATIVSTLFMSLDGVVEIDPAWHFPYFDENMGAAVGADYEGTDVLLLGRVTYDSFAGAWPDREAAGGEDATFAAQLGDLRKIVATRGSQALGWRNVERLDGDLREKVTSLKADPTTGKVLVAGSISVVRQLMAAHLLDELRLLVHPVAARRGTRLFDEGEPIYPMRLVSSETFPTGVLRLIYAPGEPPAPAAYDDITEHVPNSSSGLGTTRVSRHIQARRAEVYRALLDAEAVQHWMVPDGMTSQVHAFEPSVGGKFRISLTYDEPTAAGKSDSHTDTFHGRFVALTPDTEVVQAVEFETTDPDLQGEMRISYTLTEAPDGGTDLVGVHENLPAGVSAQDNELGWNISIDKLGRLCEAQP
jgi:dihydrofolate reductase/uncharacterized protein YndB with AHSA1/START domain